MEALLAFAATLLAFRFAGELAGRWRKNRAPEMAAWAASLAAYAIASGALAWGAAYGWSDIGFKVYYLAGGLLTAPLLGVGSLLLAGRRWAAPVGLVYTGLAVGVTLAMTLTTPVSGTAIPEAQAHLELVPERLLAILGNSLGTIAVIAVAITTFRRHRLGNALIVAGTATAAVGSAVAGLGAAPTALFIALAVVLLYAGFLAASGAAIRLPGMPRQPTGEPTS